MERKFRKLSRTTKQEKTENELKHFQKLLIFDNWKENNYNFFLRRRNNRNNTNLQLQS